MAKRLAMNGDRAEPPWDSPGWQAVSISGFGLMRVT
jgi:hypothetical protein